jgi:hypothetical protein
MAATAQRRSWAGSRGCSQRKLWCMRRSRRSVKRAAWIKQAMPNFGTGLTTRERALAGEITQVNIFQDFLTLEYEQEKLSRYSVEWQLDERHLARVGNPRFYRHPYQSPQQELWQAGSVEWFVIIRNAPPETQKPSGGDATVIAS